MIEISCVRSREKRLWSRCSLIGQLWSLITQSYEVKQRWEIKKYICQLRALWRKNTGMSMHYLNKYQCNSRDPGTESWAMAIFRSLPTRFETTLTWSPSLPTWNFLWPFILWTLVFQEQERLKGGESGSPHERQRPCSSAGSQAFPTPPQGDIDNKNLKEKRPISFLLSFLPCQQEPGRVWMLCS